MEADTPRIRRQPPPSYSHRLQPLGQRSNRHTSTSSARHTRARSPLMTALPPVLNRRGPSQGHARGRNDLQSSRAGSMRSHQFNNSPPRSLGIRGPQQIDAPTASHPFQLANTLSNINYNQRTRQVRSNPNQRHVSATSSQSSTGGGVDVHSSSSSGSSRTIGPATAARRKRVLSISSDDSFVEARGVFEY